MRSSCPNLTQANESDISASADEGRVAKEEKREEGEWDQVSAFGTET